MAAPGLTKTMCSLGPGAHFFARVQILNLVPGHRHRVRILALLLEKIGGVHISAQRVAYSGTKCKRCLLLIQTISPCRLRAPHPAHVGTRRVQEIYYEPYYESQVGKTNGRGGQS